MIPYHNIKKCPDCEGEIIQHQDFMYIQVICKKACQGLISFGNEMLPQALITINKIKFQKEVLSIKKEIFRFFDETLNFREEDCKLIAKVLTEGKVPSTEIRYEDSVGYKQASKEILN